MELSGKKVAEALKKKMKCSTHPILATLRVGEVPSDVAYERGLGKRLLELGMEVKHFTLPDTVSQEELNQKIEELNNDKHIHGIIVFQPLPHGLSAHAIAPNKDVDCSTLINQGKLLAGLPCYQPNAAAAVIALLEHYRIPLLGTKVTLIGRSSVVGRPLSILLIQAGATVTVCNSQTKNLPQIARSSGILISAVGQPNFITPEFVHDKQLVVDIGTNYVDGKLCGDISPEIHHIVGGYTPTPGGIGPVTTMVLAKQVADSTIGLPAPVFLGR
ncbi:MAG: bifunctional 5,10-methylenetetrahydrofolate dehydrogenase/5,10-methenyltetrahydrofolate cyclohydrolase [Eubacteriales bacterium]